MSTQGCVPDLSAALLALMLDSPGSCLMGQFSHVLHQREKQPEDAASAHPSFDGLHALSVDARVDSSCHGRHEDRLTASHNPPPLPKRSLAAIPLQVDSEARGPATIAQLSSITFAGPAPPFLAHASSRAPPLTPSHA